MRCQELIGRLQSLSDPGAVAGMARYGINPENTFGVSIPELRKIARECGKDHDLAAELWSTGTHEARILASMVAVPGSLTEAQAEAWAAGFDSWDVCDQCCNNLLRRTHFAHRKAAEWARREEEFVKRAGFVLMACLAVHDKQADDKVFRGFFPLIEAEAADGRNYVKKAVNWALRQIGKRNPALNRQAVALAGEICNGKAASARWVGSHALRELASESVQRRLGG